MSAPQRRPLGGAANAPLRRRLAKATRELPTVRYPGEGETAATAAASWAKDCLTAGHQSEAHPPPDHAAVPMMPRHSWCVGDLPRSSASGAAARDALDVARFDGPDVAQLAAEATAGFPLHAGSMHSLAGMEGRGIVPCPWLLSPALRDEGGDGMMSESESNSRVGSSSDAAAWAHGSEQYEHAQMLDGREGPVATHLPRRALLQARSALPQHIVERRSDVADHDGRPCAHSSNRARAHASGSNQAPLERAFINGWAIPCTSWLTPSHETMAAEQDSSFWHPLGARFAL